MRRWFGKQEHEPEESEKAGVGPAPEETRELPQAPGEEAFLPQAEEEAGALLETLPAGEELAAEVAGAETTPEAEAAPAAPRRGFFQRLFDPYESVGESRQEAGTPVTEAVPPTMAPPPPEIPEEPPAAEALPEETPEPQVIPEAASQAAAMPEEAPDPQAIPQETPIPLEIAEPLPKPAREAEAAAAVEEGIIDLEEVLTEEERAVEIKKRRFRRFREGLARTRKNLSGGLESLFLGDREVDAGVLEELEEILISADIGVDTSLRLVEVIRDRVKRRELRNATRLKEALREEMVALLRGPEAPPRLARPWVVLLVGVNGVGKTTTIAKLAYQDRKQMLTPLLIAADTFRAAAVEQLEIWGERVGAQVVKQKTGADPAAVVFDGLSAALSRGADMVYVDTAGRLHTKVNLMEELKKIHRTAAKKLPGAPHETLLILDATTGQNALSQARLFHEAVGVTGIILTKLDGTAKGGMALAVAHETGLPLRYLGVGEGMDDLQPFDPEAYVAAILD
ncbi:MAG: signal recognition particle-docking protein FtsY [Thermodesulfobacteriota bacterium]